MPSIHTSVLDMACLASHGAPRWARAEKGGGGVSTCCDPGVAARDRLKLLKYGPLDPARFHFTKLLVTIG